MRKGANKTTLRAARSGGVLSTKEKDPQQVGRKDDIPVARVRREGNIQEENQLRGREPSNGRGPSLLMLLIAAGSKKESCLLGWKNLFVPEKTKRSAHVVASSVWSNSTHGGFEKKDVERRPFSRAKGGENLRGKSMKRNGGASTTGKRRTWRRGGSLRRGRARSFRRLHTIVNVTPGTLYRGGHVSKKKRNALRWGKEEPRVNSSEEEKGGY